MSNKKFRDSARRIRTSINSLFRGGPNYSFNSFDRWTNKGPAASLGP